MTATTLYLVSAEKKGLRYWKIGITHHDDPLKRDRKQYKQILRTQRFTRSEARTLELIISRVFAVMQGCLSEVEWLTSACPKNYVVSIYDLVVDEFRNGNAGEYEQFWINKPEKLESLMQKAIWQTNKENQIKSMLQTVQSNPYNLPAEELLQSSIEFISDNPYGITVEELLARC